MGGGAKMMGRLVSVSLCNFILFIKSFFYSMYMLKKETLSEKEFVLHYIWASTRENWSSRFANNKGVDQPAHSRRQINVFVIRCLEIASFCSRRG